MAKLMTLKEFMIWLENTPDIITEIEIKAKGVAPPIFRTIDGSPAADRCIVFSGVREYIDELLHTAASGIPTGLRLGANIRRLTQDLKSELPRQGFYEVGLNVDYLIGNDISWLLDNGIQVFSNLGDFPGGWHDICTSAVAGFKSNYTAAFLKWYMDYST